MIKSLLNNKYGIILMLVSAVLVCFGQYFWKIANGNYWYLAIGFALYGGGALAMLVAYKFGKMSILQPILSINYVLAIIIGHFLLKEKITVYDLIGIGIIFTGVVCIALSDSSAEENEKEGIEQ